METMKTPVPFILTGEGGTNLEINPQARAVLSKVQKPVVVVSVVGMYRTGKSFLLNRLMGRTDGFPLGSTVEAKTKGIWMWVGDLPSDPSKALVLLDTEGLHDPEKGSKTHDVQIFTLAVLLSSILVYNTKGNIDQNSIDGLRLALELTHQINSKTGREEETGETFHEFFPMLIWAVRDFQLKLEKGGEMISADDYLENCLALKNGFGPEVDSYNSLRRAIRHFFHNRRCFAFPQPANLDEMGDLDKMKPGELNPKFLQEGDKFSNFVNDRVPIKVVKGQGTRVEVTGSMWMTLAEKYVAAIIDGNINIESTFDSLMKTANAKALEEAITSYEKSMNKLKLPLGSDALGKKNTEAHASANEMFRKATICIQKNQENSDKLNKKLDELYNLKVKENERVSHEECTQKLENLYQPIFGEVQRGAFTKPGGHSEYVKAVS